MSDKVEQGFKIFDFLRDKGFRDTTSSFLVGSIVVSIGWYAYTDSRINNELELKDNYIKRNDELKNRIHLLESKLIKADEDCTSRVIFFNQMIKDLQHSTAETKHKSEQLADKQKESVNQIAKIKSEVKKKVK